MRLDMVIISAIIESITRMRILIVDDEPHILEAFALSLSNHDVTTCSDGETCLMYYFHAQCEASIHDSRVNGAISPYDIVILDHRLLNKDGIDVAKEILAMNPAQKIILITGWPTEYLDTKGLGIRVLQKPIEPQELIDSVELSLAA